MSTTREYRKVFAINTDSIVSVLCCYVGRSIDIRDLKIDNAASSKTRCQYVRAGRSFLEFDCFNNHLKLVLVTNKYFCWPKRYAFCCMLDFQNASYVVACFRVAQGT